MITVRFPDGFSIQYNDLTWVKWGGNCAHLYKDSTEKGGWKVTVPRECVIEFISPCRTYNASRPSEDLTAEVAMLRKKIASLTRKIGKVSQ
jgi:hypothetical protein